MHDKCEVTIADNDVVRIVLSNGTIVHVEAFEREPGKIVVRKYTGEMSIEPMSCNCIKVG